VDAVTDVFTANNESVSVAAPPVIQFPKSIVILPLPTLCVDEVKPVNSRV
jgi:hypothetical protein